MCNGIKANGDKCGRKAEWCFQHIDQKPIEEPEEIEPILITKSESSEIEYDDVSDEEEETIELNLDDEKIVQTSTVVPATMPPNETPIVSSKPDSVILVESNYQPIKKIFDDFECFITHRNDEYQYCIENCAVGEAFVSWTLLKDGSASYLHDTEGCCVIRVDKHYIKSCSKRKFSKFIWFYNLVDMHAFIKFFHNQTRFECECHEVFIGRDPRIKLFMDLETVIPKDYYKKLVNAAKPSSLAEMVCDSMMNALDYTLEAVDERYERYQKNIDYAVTERSRQDGPNTFKISFHIVTNIVMHVSECKAIIKLMKNEYISLIPTISDEYKAMLCGQGFVDTQPYRKNGSLSLPGGTKFGNSIKIVKLFKRKLDNMHLLDNTDECITYHEFNDDLPIQANQSDREAFEESSSDFVKKVLAKFDTEHVPAYDSESVDIYANSIRGNLLYVKRKKPSHCTECDRVHDNADTLMLLFNEKQNAAFWKCAHCEDMKFKRWFGNHVPKEVADFKDATDFSEDDLDAFAKIKLPKPVQSSISEYSNPDLTPFQNEVLKHVGKIPGYQYHDFYSVVESSPAYRGNWILHFARKRSSNCSICECEHGDDTLLLRINDKTGTADWSCKDSIKSIMHRFYNKETMKSTKSKNAESIESRLGTRWVHETKKLCDKSKICYDKLVEGMLKNIETNGEYCMMDWRDEFVKPMNRITHDSQTLLGDFIALAGNWVYKNAEEAAKFAAQIIDPTIVLFANNDIFVRTKLDDCEQDAAKKTPASLMKTINFRCFTKVSNGNQKVSSVTLDRLMLSFSSMFHRYNRYVSRWDIDIKEKGTFSMCTPYRGRLLQDEDYNPAVFDRFLEFVLEVICDNDNEKYQFFLDYCEYSIRFKNAKTGVAIIFYGIDEGCGKGTIMKVFDWGFGSWNSAFEAGTLSRTVGDRNSHILGKKLVMIDELDKASELSTDAQMEKWKSMITEDKLATTPLYSSTIKIDNFTNHIVATNNLKVLRIPSMKDIGWRQ